MSLFQKAVVLKQLQAQNKTVLQEKWQEFQNHYQSHNISNKFQSMLQRKFELQDLPKKLQDWYLLSYSDFIKELAKKKIKFSLSQEAEWENYFTQKSKKALALKNQINKTDKEIDQMVYELYGLREEEIEIVE